MPSKKETIEANENRIDELNQLITATEETKRTNERVAKEAAADENAKIIANYKAEIAELERVNEHLKKRVRDGECDDAAGA